MYRSKSITSNKVQPKIPRSFFPGSGQGPTPVQRKGSGKDGNVDPSVEEAIHSESKSGRPLPFATRNFMEQRIGADFSQVKVHTGSGAVQLSRRLNAQAFTHGADIYFTEDKFAPGTPDGKHLLAHELTHVVQQQGTGTTRGIQRTPARQCVWQRKREPQQST